MTKQNKKTIDFVRIEIDNNLVRHSNGKIGRGSVFNSTTNCGTNEVAKIEAEKLAESYREKGFIDSSILSENEEIIFDKAKWHLGGDFPEKVNQFQAYVHTGMFICWIVFRDMLSEEYNDELNLEVKQLLNRSVSPSSFYHDYFDGVFSSEQIDPTIINFVKKYFDFENGLYLKDYTNTLDKDDNLPSIFHIADNWENFDKLKPILDQRFNEWKLQQY